MDKISIFRKELDYINNPKYRKSAESLVSLLPDYFFEVPASSTGKYHPMFSLGNGGLLRHTKAAVRIAKELYDNSSLTSSFTDNEKDLMLIAIIMHDGLKLGLERDKYTKFEHPLLMSNYIKENKSKTEFTDEEIEFLYNVISSHMGPWNTNQYSDVILPIPESKYQKFVHLCDYLASRRFLDVKFDDNNDIV